MVHSLQNHKPKNNINNIGYLKADIKTSLFNYLCFNPLFHIYLQDYHKVHMQYVKAI